MKKNRTKLNINDDLLRFRALKNQFDALSEELQRIHEEWHNMGRTSLDFSHQRRARELIVRETKILAELNEVLTLAHEALRPNMERYR